MLIFFPIAVLEEFLIYVVKLDFDTQPDYDRCRKMFKTALTKAKCPLDGKIDFTSPKKAPKKVRNSPRKRKSRLSSDEDMFEASSDDDDSIVDESFAEDKPVMKKISRPAMSPIKDKLKFKKTATKKVAMRDQGCQTSPAFVKAAKASRKKKTDPANAEMDEFVKKSVASAKKAVKKSQSAKTSPAKKAKSGNDEAALSNPTPAMLALMAKKAESGAKKQRTKK